MKFKLGYECKAYVGEASKAPTSELTNVSDLSVTLSRDAKDVTARYSGAFKVYIPGMIDPEISFTMRADSDATTNTNLATIRTAWLAGTPLAFKLELGEGAFFQSDVVVTEYSATENTEDPVDIKVTLKPTIVSDTFRPVVEMATA